MDIQSKQATEKRTVRTALILNILTTINLVMQCRTRQARVLLPFIYEMARAGEDAVSTLVNSALLRALESYKPFAGTFLYLRSSEYHSTKWRYR